MSVTKDMFGAHLGTLYYYPLAVMGQVSFEPPIRLIPNEQAQKSCRNTIRKKFDAFLILAEA